MVGRSARDSLSGWRGMDSMVASDTVDSRFRNVSKVLLPSLLDGYIILEKNFIILEKNLAIPCDRRGVRPLD